VAMKWNCENDSSAHMDLILMQRYVLTLLYFTTGGPGWYNNFNFLTPKREYYVDISDSYDFFLNFLCRNINQCVRIIISDMFKFQYVYGINSKYCTKKNSCHFNSIKIKMLQLQTENWNSWMEWDKSTLRTEIFKYFCSANK